MSTYLMLLHEKPNLFVHMSPDELQRAIERYQAWGQQLQDSGHFVTSDKLTDGQGRVLRKTDGALRVIDGPFAETKEVIGGYFAVTATDYDEAVDLAGDCPHLDYGGTIEIREVDLMGKEPDPA